MPTAGSQRRPPPWQRLNLGYFGKRQRPRRESETHDLYEWWFHTRCKIIAATVGFSCPVSFLCNLKRRLHTCNKVGKILRSCGTFMFNWSQTSSHLFRWPRHIGHSVAPPTRKCIMQQRKISHHILNLVFSLFNKREGVSLEEFFSFAPHTTDCSFLFSRLPRWRMIIVSLECRPELQAWVLF